MLSSSIIRFLAVYVWKTHQYIDCKQMTCKFFMSWDVASTLRICYAPPSNGVPVDAHFASKSSNHSSTGSPSARSKAKKPSRSTTRTALTAFSYYILYHSLTASLSAKPAFHNFRHPPLNLKYVFRARTKVSSSRTFKASGGAIFSRKY